VRPIAADGSTSTPVLTADSYRSPPPEMEYRRFSYRDERTPCVRHAMHTHCVSYREGCLRRQPSLNASCVAQYVPGEHRMPLGTVPRHPPVQNPHVRSTVAPHTLCTGGRSGFSLEHPSGAEEIETVRRPAALHAHPRRYTHTRRYTHADRSQPQGPHTGPAECSMLYTVQANPRPSAQASDLMLAAVHWQYSGCTASAA
jgi:hypothetical protein